MIHGYEVECTACKGTGSSHPDCKLCRGYRTVKAKRAYAFRWKKADLVDLDDDGYCECPSCGDDATTCMFCYGDGTTDPIIHEQQRMRVLIQAKHGFIPLVFRHDYRGFFIRDENMYLLSNEAAGALREDGMLRWYCSVFGDELYLTPKGKEAAKEAWREYRALCRRWVASERCKARLIEAYRAQKAAACPPASES